MEYIIIPESGEKITVGAVVQISEESDTKYVMLNGIYIYDGTQATGLFLSSIPDRITVPIDNVDLSKLIVISDGTGGCSCPCEPHPNLPPPHRAYNCVEEYVENIAYHTGQLIWLNHGEIYQAACDFVSSKSESTVEANFSADVESSYLVPISEKISSTVGLAYALDFEQEFQTSEPTKAQADVFLSKLNPPIPPAPGITLVNINPVSATFTISFMYCKSGDELVFVQIDNSIRETISDIENRIVDIQPISNIELEQMLT